MLCCLGFLELGICMLWLASMKLLQNNARTSLFYSSCSFTWDNTQKWKLINFSCCNLSLCSFMGRMLLLLYYSPFGLIYLRTYTYYVYIVHTYIYSLHLGFMRSCKYLLCYLVVETFRTRKKSFNFVKYQYALFDFKFGFNKTLIHTYNIIHSRWMIDIIT